VAKFKGLINLVMDKIEEEKWELGKIDKKKMHNLKNQGLN
jgi:hypothetical protein